MKKLEKTRQTIRELKDELEKSENQLRQLKNQEKKILRQDKERERKQRTHRLITRGAMLESLIENPEELSDEDIEILLEAAFNTPDFKETLSII
ncbi:MAG: DUF3847 domain-containing protein [Erysipelotrichia bacterium]|nr:DUF3847 domain-containing protein [Erysipelotrichia bacterium]